MELQSWNFNAAYRKGALNHVPDNISRYQEDQVASLTETRDDWYLRRLSAVQKSPWKYPDWKVEFGVLYHKRHDELLDPVTNNEYRWRLVVPQKLQTIVLLENHFEPSSGHFGVDKIYDCVVQDYTWPGVYQDVRKFVTTCHECQRHKASQTLSQGLLDRRVVETPWAVVSADCMEFPPNRQRYTHVVVFQDLFTQWVEIYPLRNANGRAIARAYEDLVLFRFGCPNYLLTDNGKEFDNWDIKGMCDKYGIKLVTTPPPYHHQGNPTERSN